MRETEKRFHQSNFEFENKILKLNQSLRNIELAYDQTKRTVQEMTGHVAIFDKQLEKGLHNVEILKIQTEDIRKIMCTQKVYE